MKKLLLLAAALVFAVACNQVKPTPEPEPEPEPTGDPVINLTKIDQRSVLDTVHLIIDNFNGTVKITPKDEYFALAADFETTPGIIILRSFTMGETDIEIKCGDVKTFTIKAKYAQAVTKPMYTQPLIEAFDKTVDEVKALEVARGNVFKELTVSGGNGFAKFTVTNPAEPAVGGEEVRYVFKVKNTDSYGPCFQSSIYAYYESVATGEDTGYLAWASTTESNYYGGEDKNNNSLALTRDLVHLITYATGKYATGQWGYTGHYQVYTGSVNAPTKGFQEPVVENDVTFTPILKK